MARITLECPRCGGRTVVENPTDDDLDALECPACEVGLRPVREPNPEKAKKAAAEKPAKPKKPAKKTKPVVFWLLFAALLAGGPGAVAAVWWFQTKNEPAAPKGPEPDYKDPVPVNLHPRIDPEPTPTPVAAAPAAADTIWLLTNDNAEAQLARLAERKPGQVIRMNRVKDKLHDELLRQSWWLIAAHDFGLTVGDENLDEPPPDDLPADRQFRIRGDYVVQQIPDAHYPNAVPWDVFGWGLLQGPKAGEKKFWEGTHLYDFAGDEKPAQRVEEAEAQARGVFQKALKAAGFTPRPVNLSEASPPADVETLLADLRATSAFAAVRALHAAVKAQGESPALLGGLVRGYAQLGLLTTWHWTGHAAVFKARALLYAQRLVARNPLSPTAVWLRAYAAALAGKHAMALADLAAAAKLAETQANVPAPPWAEAIDAYVRFDAARLKAVREKAPTPLVRLLQFLAVEAPHSEVGAQAAVRAGKDYLAADPAGYRVHDSLCRTGTDAQRDAATQAGLTAFHDHFRDHLAAVPGLPKAVRDRLADPATPPAAVFAALRAAGDGGGLPSWQLLADVVQGDYYALAWHRLDYLANTRRFSTVEAAPPLLEPAAGHPLAALLDAFRFDPKEDGLRVYQKLTAVPNHRLDVHCVGYGRLLERVGDDGDNSWSETVGWRADETYETTAVRSRVTPKVPSRGRWALEYEHASPRAPAGVAQRIERERPEDQARLGEYERAYPNDPHVLHALGAYHARRQQTAEAVQFWTRCLAASADWAVYRDLARLHQAQNQLDEWEKTLDAALKQDHLVSDHAQVRQELARGYMERRQFDKAEPFIVAAAGGGDPEVLLAAAACEVELAKWDEAERFFRRAALKDGEASFDWYYACRRTGRMNVAAAERAVQEHLPDLRGITPQAKVMREGHYFLMAGKPDWAYVEYRRANSRETASDASMLFAVLMADSRGDAAERDGLFQRLQSFHNPSFASGAFILSLYPEWFAAKAPPDAAGMAKALDSVHPAARADADLFAGWYLYNRGQTDRAAGHWKAILANPKATPAYRAHAACFLQQLQEDGTIAFGGPP